MRKDIINIAVVAHVDAGKSTLVDALLSQSGSEKVDIEQIMDSNDLERERGITIYSKNCSIEYKGIKINIVDTPGHADFSSEVERIIKTVDTVVLLVDSSEGPMPQTRVVLKKALARGLKPILLVNKIDKKDQRAEEVVDMTFDLFVELGATDEQLDFPILYGVAKQGIIKEEIDDDSNSLEPLFNLLLDHVDVYPDYSNEDLQMQVSSLSYSEYLGRQGVGRVNKGILKKGAFVTVCKRDKTVVKSKIGTIYINEGLRKKEVDVAYCGDIVTFTGISDISIGDTVCKLDSPNPMDTIEIEEPTMAMNFLVNDSPFAGISGKYVTSREIMERLDKELETNVGLRVEQLKESGGLKVSGRGELHLSILIERMRREGYELCVSKPEVLLRDIEGTLHEPFEKVIVSVPNQYSGTIINQLNVRKGIMNFMDSDGSYTKLEYLVPTRGLIGYRSEFINSTHGYGIMEKSFDSYNPYVGKIQSRINGVFIAKEDGKAMTYSLLALSERGVMFVEPATKVYTGMIVGMNSRDNDLVVNPCKNKVLSAMRTAGTDNYVKLKETRKFTLEQALEFIEQDELVEITPDDIRLRKKILNENERRRANKVARSDA
ncbi:translational GTPase TypA [Mycoplasmatota bacterium]|nr:translational GTPase TypA [Mycoplasmatota bacterium]